MQYGRLALLARLLALPAAAIHVHTHSQRVGLADGQEKVNTCEQYNCPTTMIIKDDAATIIGRSDAECCDPLCATFKCPANTVAVPGSIVIGNSTDECCNPGRQTCEKFACPPGYSLKGSASFRTGNNTETCCFEVESMCHWWGLNHFNTFAGGRFDVPPVAKPGHYWLVRSRHLVIQAQFCPQDSKNSTSCTGKGPLVMRRLAVKLRGKTAAYVAQITNSTANDTDTDVQDPQVPTPPRAILSIEPLGNNITWGGNLTAVGTTAGDVDFRVSGTGASSNTMALLLTQRGSTMRVMLNNAVRMVVSRDNGFLSAQVYIRQSLFPGNMSGACGNWTGPGRLIEVTNSSHKMILFSDIHTWVRNKNVPQVVTDRYRAAFQEVWGSNQTRAAVLDDRRANQAVFLHSSITGRQTPPCTTTADQTAATTACKAQSASSNANWLATCIADFCLSAPSLRTNVASGSAAFYSATTAAIANTKPVVITAVAAGSACPVGTVPSVAHSATERSLLTAGFTYCNPARPLSIVGLVASSAIASACGSMQPVVPRSLAEQQKVDILARQSGTTQLWIGGTFNTVSGLWVWPDGTRITEWPGGTALTRTQFTASGGFLCTTACATSPCPWVACGGTATRIVVCEARLASGSR